MYGKQALETNLAAENSPEHGERVIDSLRVDVIPEILDEQISLALSTLLRIPLRPHDSHRLSIQRLEVEVGHSLLR